MAHCARQIETTMDQTYTVLVEWESGETAYDPLDIIAKDDPISWSDYAKRHGILDTSGWKRFWHISKNNKKVERMVNRSNLKSYRRVPFWKLGFLVLRTHGQAVEFDLTNGYSKWQDSKAEEMEQLAEKIFCR
jgi:hypothetical protein